MEPLYTAILDNQIAMSPVKTLLKLQVEAETFEGALFPFDATLKLINDIEKTVTKETLATSEIITHIKHVAVPMFALNLCTNTSLD